MPGIQFGELLPEQARTGCTSWPSVRTVNHGSGDHTKGNHWMLTGFEGPAFNAPDNRQQRRPAIGSAVARVRGADTPGMPPYVGVPHLRGGTDNLFHYAAYLGGGWNPFVVNSDPNESDYGVKNLTLAGDLTLESRSRDDASLMASNSIAFAHAARAGACDDLDEHQQVAFDLLTSRRACARRSTSRANPTALRDRYGRHTFGQSALLARRLVEHGVTFVTVNCVPWDHHGSPGQYKTEEGRETADSAAGPRDCGPGGRPR